MSEFGSFECTAANDNTFGPIVDYACRNGFDFTLLFEETILSIPVQVLLLIFLPWRVWELTKTNVKVNGGVLRPVKTLGLISLVGLNAALMAFWVQVNDSTPIHKTRASTANAVLTLIASIGVVLLSWLEHERNPQPSWLVTSYLFFSAFLDLARTRTLWIVGTYRLIPALLTASLALRAVLLVLESLRKRGLLKEQYKDRNADFTRTLFEICTFWWVNPLLGVGYRKNMELKDLYPLDPGMATDYWMEQFSEAWAKVEDKTKPGALFYMSIRTLWWPLLGCVPSRLLQIAFTYVQPLMVKKAVELAALPPGQPFDNYGYGLIGAFAITYTGLAIVSGQYQWRTSRASTVLRGGTMALLFRDALNLDVTSSEINPTSAITLINTDANNMIEAIHMLHEIWANTAELALAVYLVWREMGAACAMPIVVAVLLLVAAFFIAVPSGTSQAIWIQASQERVTATSKTLGNVRWIKISGLQDTAFAVIRALRKHELKISVTYRMLLGCTLLLLIFSAVWSPILTFCLYAGLAQRDGRTIDVATVFAAYSALGLLNSPLTWIMLAFPTLAGSLQSFQRVQNFLTGKKRQDNRKALLAPTGGGGGDNGDAGTSYATTPLSPFAGSEGGLTPFAQDHKLPGSFEMRPFHDHKADYSLRPAIIASMDGVFSWHEEEGTVLDISDWQVRRRALTLVLGPVGCGKSTLLKGLMGELSAFDGTVRTNYSGVAYCSQTAWIPNETVRNVIIGASGWNEEWYTRVVRACALEQDLRIWPKAHDTLTGTQGASLSGGQKQRLAIARAVYSRKEFLVMDDVLSALDASTENFIFQNLWGEGGLLREGEVTTVLASSDQRRVPFADQAVVLDMYGTIVARGSPQELTLKYGQSFSKVSEMMKDQIAAVPGGPAKEDEKDKDKDAAGGQLPDQSLPNTMPVETLEIEDPTRRMGDWGTYAMYARAAGRLTLLVFMAAMAVYAFSASFPSVWLGWWAESIPADGNKYLGKWLGVYVVLGLGAMLGAMTGIFQLIVVIINKCGLHFHELLLQAASRAPLSFHSKVDTGVTVNRFSEDLRLIDMELPTAAFGVATTLAFLFAQVIIVAVTSKYLAAAFPLLLLMFWFIQHFYLRTSRQLRLLDIELNAPVNSQLIETLHGLETIRAYQWESSYVARSLFFIDNSQMPRYLLACVQCWLTLHIDMVITLLAISFVVLTTTVREQIGAANMGIGLNSVLGLGGATKTVLSFWVLLEISLGAVTRVHKFDEKTVKEGDGEGPFGDDAHQAWPENGEVEIRGVTASYDKSGPCLNQVEFTIQPGERVAICGRTGSGKSSLTLAMLRLMDLDAGSITIDGVDISTLSHDFVRSKLVALPQECFIMDSSVRQNIDPSGKVPDGELIDVLRKVQIWSKIEKRGGLDAVVDSSVFSQGEAQLFVFARAMARKSKVLILDEFTSSLDRETARIVDGLLHTYFKGWTILAVTHKLSTVLNYDKVAVLDRGRLLEYAAPRRLLESESTFKELYETYTRGEKDADSERRDSDASTQVDGGEDRDEYMDDDMEDPFDETMSMPVFSPGEGRDTMLFSPGITPGGSRDDDEEADHLPDMFGAASSNRPPPPPPPSAFSIGAEPAPPQPAALTTTTKEKAGRPAIPSMLLSPGRAAALARNSSTTTAPPPLNTNTSTSTRRPHHHSRRITATALPVVLNPGAEHGEEHHGEEHHDYDQDREREMQRRSRALSPGDPRQRAFSPGVPGRASIVYAPGQGRISMMFAPMSSFPQFGDN